MDLSKKLLNEAFRRFRKAGLIARQRFSCCMGCAGSELASQIGDEIKEEWNSAGLVAAKEIYDRLQKKVSGAVFYTKQDAEKMDEGVYLCYGPVEVYCVGEFGKKTEEVGRMVCAILTEVGLKVRWDGDPRQRIWVEL